MVKDEGTTQPICVRGIVYMLTMVLTHLVMSHTVLSELTWPKSLVVVLLVSITSYFSASLIYKWFYLPQLNDAKSNEGLILFSSFMSLFTSAVLSAYGLSLLNLAQFATGLFLLALQISSLFIMFVFAYLLTYLMFKKLYR